MNAKQKYDKIIEYVEKHKLNDETVEIYHFFYNGGKLIDVSEDEGTLIDSYTLIILISNYIGINTTGIYLYDGGDLEIYSSIFDNVLKALEEKFGTPVKRGIPDKVKKEEMSADEKFLKICDLFKKHSEDGRMCLDDGFYTTISKPNSFLCSTIDRSEKTLFSYSLLIETTMYSSYMMVGLCTGVENDRVKELINYVYQKLEEKYPKKEVCNHSDCKGWKFCPMCGTKIN